MLINQRIIVFMFPKISFTSDKRSNKTSLIDIAEKCKNAEKNDID